MNAKLLIFSTVMSFLSFMPLQASAEAFGFDDISSENSEIMKAAEQTFGGESGLYDKIKRMLNSKEKVKVNGEVKEITRLEKELNRYKVSINIDSDFSFLNDSGNLLVGYKLLVRPTLVYGEQQRLDIYTVNLGLRDGLFAGAQLQVTFARVFKGDNAKLRAILAAPLWLSKVPRNADEINEKMESGHIVRVELFSRVGYGKDKSFSDGVANVGLGYAREATFLADIYKHSATQVRTRFLGIKNRGQLTLGIHAKSTGLDLSGVPSKIKDLATVGAELSISLSDLLFYDYPIDTLMTDYFFKTSDKNAKDALDEIFSSISKLGFVALFNPMQNDEDLGAKLLSYASKAQKLVDEDSDLPLNQKRVHAFFRGRMTSSVVNFLLGAKMSGLLGARVTTGSYSTFVRNFKGKNQVEYFILENASDYVNTNSLFSRNQYFKNFNIDLLLSADKDKNPNEFLDIVVKTHVGDKNFSKRNVKEINELIKRSIPKELDNNNSTNDFVLMQDQSNASLKLQVNYGINGFLTMQKLTKNEIVSKLWNFLENHPERYLMQIDTPHAEGDSKENLTSFVERMSYALYDGFNAPSKKDRLQAFRWLKNNKVFQNWVSTEFLPTLIPTKDLNEQMQVKLEYSSDAVPLKTLKLGKNNITQIYEAVEFMRNTVNDRSLELRVNEVNQLNFTP